MIFKDTIYFNRFLKEDLYDPQTNELIFPMNIMIEDIEQIIEDNERLINIGGHFFEGETKHNRKIHGLLQMSDLIPFEEQGLISRINAYDGIGKRYVSAFVCNKKIQGK